MLTDSGRVRWNRIENLVAESSKSVGYDRSQLWRVADWIFGDPGAGVRKPVAAELARLIDSAVAGLLAWPLPWLACISLGSSSQASGRQQFLHRQRRQRQSHACAVSLLAVLSSAQCGVQRRCERGC